MMEFQVYAGNMYVGMLRVYIGHTFTNREGDWLPSVNLQSYKKLNLKRVS